MWIDLPDDILQILNWAHVNWTWFPHHSSEVSKMLLKSFLSNLSLMAWCLFSVGITHHQCGTLSPRIWRGGANGHEAGKCCSHQPVLCLGGSADPISATWTPKPLRNNHQATRILLTRWVHCFMKSVVQPTISQKTKTHLVICSPGTN